MQELRTDPLGTPLMPKEITIEEIWLNLLQQDGGLPVEDKREYLTNMLSAAATWAPDVFCLVAAVLKISGAHTAITRLDHQIPSGIAKLSHDISLKNIGIEWQRELVDNWADTDHRSERLGPVGKQVLEKLLMIADAGNLPISRSCRDRKILMPLLELLVIADEACKDFGLPSPYATPELLMPSWGAQYLADCRLQPGLFGSSLCKYIHPTRARVLPKSHTSNRGLTLRSMSHYVCFIEADECKPMWYTVPNCGMSSTCLNLLVVPAPYEIKQGMFAAGREIAHPHYSFEFSPSETRGALVAKIQRLCKCAEMRAGKVNALVLPELAVSATDYRLLRKWAISEGITVIAGLGGPTQDGVEENRFCLDIPLSDRYAVHLRQRKHHRWQLEDHQILQYDLARDLDPARIYREGFAIGDRHLCFLALNPELLTSVLICEDLAQYEPVGRMIRAVGPDLVIALLMDGPQISSRWPGRYATVLSDDPGCSVLTVSSIGMTLRTSDKHRNKDNDKSRFVALWKDPVSGAREISLDPGASAILLTLTSRPAVEWTADFRRSCVHNPQLSSVVQIEDLDTHQSEIRLAQQGMMNDVTFLSPAEASALARLAQLTRLTQLTQLTQVHVYRKEIASRLSEVLSGMDAAGRQIAKGILYRQLLDEYQRPKDESNSDYVLPEKGNVIEKDSIEIRDSSIAANMIIEWANALRHRHSSAFASDEFESFIENTALKSQ